MTTSGCFSTPNLWAKVHQEKHFSTRFGHLKPRQQHNASGWNHGYLHDRKQLYNERVTNSNHAFRFNRPTTIHTILANPQAQVDCRMDGYDPSKLNQTMRERPTYIYNNSVNIDRRNGVLTMSEWQNDMNYPTEHVNESNTLWPSRMPWLYDHHNRVG